MNEKSIRFLVGDNPFHGISHLSQERARHRLREEPTSDAAHAARLVEISLQNGASGFMFSVSETTLSILETLSQNNKIDLYAIVPYAYEYVRMAAQVGGISGLAKKIMRQMAFSRVTLSVAPRIVGLIRANPSAFLEIYLTYEMSRIKSVSKENVHLKSVLLHEIITDMALAFNLDWLFKSYVDFLLEKKISPGFETRNFAYLVSKFKSWGIDFDGITITAPFNKVGFQMNPSKVECEKALEEVSEAEIVAMSILAAGYLKPSEAIGYIADLSNIADVVVGVSKEQQAKETFKLLREKLSWNIPEYPQSS